MRNVHEVLQQKEMELARVRQEVEALRFVAPLLIGSSDQSSDPSELWPVTSPKNRWPLELEDMPQASAGS